MWNKCWLSLSLSFLEGFTKVSTSSSPIFTKVISPPLGSTKTPSSSSTMASASTSRAVDMELDREDTPEYDGDRVDNAQLRSPNERVYIHYSWSPPSTPGTLASSITIEAPPLPPKPEGWTRFVCISDTHSMTFPVPDGDVLLHSGDLTNTGTLFDFQKTMTWLTGLPHKHKMWVNFLFLITSIRRRFVLLLWEIDLIVRIIAGNHDVTLHTHDGWYDSHYDRWHRSKGKQVCFCVLILTCDWISLTIGTLRSPYDRMWKLFDDYLPARRQMLLVSYISRTRTMSSRRWMEEEFGVCTGHRYVRLR